ncbi:MAG: histidine kinase dimerization/phospho-acceptor domain-containing protein, partial [Reyranella sp.]|nr:histidine kinase dimerization/phospho-acceptor domain-containing protein [Reyranella sp.]
MLNAVLLGLNLGLPVAVLWIAAYFISELITRATVAAVERAPEPGQRLKLNLLLGMVVATLVWLAAILLYWRSGGMAERLTAIVILATLMIHAQSFAFRSKAALLVVGGLPALTLILLPAFFGDFYGIERVTLVMLAIGAVAQMGLSTMVNARTFAALQDARGEAINANHAKSAFLAMMSHELRTPMNGVLGMAHALKLDRLRPRQAEQVDMLIRSGDGLMTILNDILDLSKIEAGKLELEAIAFDLHDLGARV